MSDRATIERDAVGQVTATGTGLGRSMLASLRDSAGLLVLFAVVFIAVSVLVPGFCSLVNMKGLALSVSLVGMVACTMLFCLASGHFDLSVESVVAMSGVLAAVVMTATKSVTLGVSAGILAGGVVGALNGIVIARWKINALITTLATMQIARGLAYIVSDGQAVGISEEGFFVLGNSLFLGVPVPVWITLICFALFGVVLAKTTFGRNTLAIGGNEEASRLAGIAVSRVKVTIFVMQGLVAGAAGVILASRMTSGQPKTSEGFALEVISACVLGGVSLSGGVGTMTGTIVGVLIMGTMQNAMNLMNVSPFYQYVARGAVLLAAVLFDRYRQQRRARVAKA